MAVTNKGRSLTISEDAVAAGNFERAAMDWDPIAPTHAITSVRAIFAFARPLSSKVLLSAQASVQGRQSELGFDTIAPAPEEAGPRFEFYIGPPGESPPPPPPLEGKIFQRTAPLGTDVPHVRRIEEVGLRADSFGYVVEEYDRWTGFEERIRDVFTEPLKSALAVEQVGTIDLEYRDLFVFKGLEEHYDRLSLFRKAFAHVPRNAVHPRRRWDIVLNWEDEAFPVEGWIALHNRRYMGVQVAVEGENVPLPGLMMIGAISARSGNVEVGDVDPDSAFNILRNAHDVLNQALADTLTDEMGKRLSLVPNSDI